MTVQDKEHPIAIAPGLHVVGHAAHGGEIRGLEEAYTVLEGEAFLSQHLLPYRDEGLVHESDAFYRLHVCDVSLLRLVETATRHPGEMSTPYLIRGQYPDSPNSWIPARGLRRNDVF